MPEPSTVLLSAGCSVAPFSVNLRCRSISAPIMIRSFGLLNGKPISGFSRSMKSRLSPMRPFLIRSWNALSGPFAENIWTERYSGHPPISKASCSNSGITTTVSAPITHCAAEHRIRNRDRQGRSQKSTPTDGSPTAVASIRPPRLPDISKTLVCCAAGCFSIAAIPETTSHKGCSLCRGGKNMIHRGNAIGAKFPSSDQPH